MRGRYKNGFDIEAIFILSQAKINYLTSPQE